MKGMIRTLTVVSGGKAVRAPGADITMSLRDYSFVLSGSPAPGHRVIEVRNDGDQTPRGGAGPPRAGKVVA